MEISVSDDGMTFLNGGEIIAQVNLRQENLSLTKDGLMLYALFCQLQGITDRLGIVNEPEKIATGIQGILWAQARMDRTLAATAQATLELQQQTVALQKQILEQQTKTREALEALVKTASSGSSEAGMQAAAAMARDVVEGLVKSVVPPGTPAPGGNGAAR